MKSYSIYKNTTKSIICLVFSFFLVISCAFSQELLSKGTKLKTIDFSQKDKYGRCNSQCYILEGYVYKGTLVNNQKISISDIDGKSIISGNYYTKEDGLSYIDGTYRGLQGLFQVSNKNDKTNITVNKKESANISISIVDIPYYKNDKNNTVLQKQPDGSYSLKVGHLEVSIPLATIQDVKTYYEGNKFSKEILDSKQAKMFFDNGNVFTGTVTYDYSAYKRGDFDYKPNVGELRFANGDIFYGKFPEKIYRGNISSHYSKEYTGIGFINRIIIPTEGITTFADGSVVEGDWLEKYKFSESEWRQIYENAKSLSDIKQQVLKLDKKVQQKKEEEDALIEEVEAVLDNDYYSANCHSVETLEKLRKQLEELEKSIPFDIDNLEKKSYLLKLQSGLSKAISTQIMTKKYGVVTAKKIMAGKYEIGMSKTICREIAGSYFVGILSQTATTETWKIYNDRGAYIYLLFNGDKLSSIQY